MSDVNRQLLDAVKHCHAIFDQYVSHHLAKPDYDKAAANERHRAICAEAIAAAEQAQQAEKPHLCWSCSKPVTMGQRAAADGNCPHCSAELDLEDWPPSQQQAEPVAWMYKDGKGSGYIALVTRRWRAQDVGAWVETPLYAHPPAVTVPGVKQNIGTLPVKDRYFLCRCEKCGWLGSSEECRESINHMYGDGDYYCPACGANGPDEMYEAEATFNAMLAAAQKP